MSETQVISAGEQWDQAPRATEPTAANLPAETFVRLMRARRGGLGEAVDDALAFIGRFAGADRAAVHLNLPGRPADFRGANADVPADCLAGVTAGDVVPSGPVTLVPVRVDREILGVLRFDHGGPAPVWPPDAVEAVRGAAAVLGAARHRQAALDELDQSRQRYESVLNDVGAVIVRVDGQGRMSYVNRAWTELTGIPADEMIGKDALHHVHPDDRATAAKHMAEALSGGDDDSMREVRFMTRDGRERWMEVNGRAVFDEHGVIAGF